MFAALRQQVSRQRPTTSHVVVARRWLATEAPMPAEETEELQRERYERFLEEKAKEKPLRPHLNIPVDKDHGLYAFFRRVKVEDVESYETVESNMRATELGRPWNATELRRKSFRDLHTLWYILLRERNLLATQAAEAKRLQIQQEYLDINDRDRMCRKTMARIKQILTERKLAYEQAVALQAQPSTTSQRNEQVVDEKRQLELNAIRKARLAQRERKAELAIARLKERAAAEQPNIVVEKIKPSTTQGRISRLRLREKMLLASIPKADDVDRGTPEKDA